MFTLTLVTPEKKLAAGEEIEEVFVPADRGELNILPGHAPLMTTLRPGVLRYRAKGETQFQSFAVSWGYCQVNPTGVNVLAETAERPNELDIGRINESLKEAETQLMTQAVDAETYEKLQSKMARARARKELVARTSGAGRA
jgi:F-type H+-transporting ATPase subunit epsilon